MVASAEEICNLAIAKIGHEGFIASLDEDSKGARIFNNIYIPTRDAVLSQHLWRFARKRAVLAPLTEVPPFRNITGENYFQYPDDCLRIIGTDQEYFASGTPWAREGDKIIAPTDTLKLVYIQRVKEPTFYDPCFVDALACRLGMEASTSILKDKQMREQMQRDYDRSILRAAHASATEQSGERYISEAFLSAR